MNLLEAWDIYEQDIKLEGYSKITIGNYRTQKNVAMRYFGDIDISTVTLPMLKQYYIDCGSHLKSSSLGQRIRCAKSIFRWASDEG